MNTNGLDSSLKHGEIGRIVMDRASLLAIKPPRSKVSGDHIQHRSSAALEVIKVATSFIALLINSSS